MSGTIANVTEESFGGEVENAVAPVLVDFWAEWCGPCKAVTPVLEELAEQWQGRVKIAKVNVDESPELAQRFGVRAIPTLLLFKGGEVVETQVGAVSKTQLSDALKPHLEALEAQSAADSA